MRKIRLMFLLLLCSMTLMAGAQDNPVPGKTSIRKSGLTDQSSVALTIYSNIALVKDQRDIEFGAGDNTLQFIDVAAQSFRQPSTSSH